MYDNWVFWALLSAFFAGLTAILAKIGVKDINSNFATAIRTVVVLIFSWAIVVATRQANFAAVTRKTWLFLTLSGLGTGLSWLCYFRALQLGNASRVAPVDKLSVVFVMILSVLVLREKLGWRECLGGALIFAGALVLAWPKRLIAP
jgi:transporter family protein